MDTSKTYYDKETVVKGLNELASRYQTYNPSVVIYHDKILNAMTPFQINGETSDGYHTFNELYHHRAILFSVICNTYSLHAWKSKKHHDGSMYDGMFIVGIDTPKGQATYHYDIDPYWDMFEVKELETAPEWDGHTPDEAIERIKSIPDIIKFTTFQNKQRN